MNSVLADVHDLQAANQPTIILLYQKKKKGKKETDEHSVPVIMVDVTVHSSFMK